MQTGSQATSPTPSSNTEPKPNKNTRELWKNLEDAKKVEQQLILGADPNAPCPKDLWVGWPLNLPGENTPLTYSVYRDYPETASRLLANPRINTDKMITVSEKEGGFTYDVSHRLLSYALYKGYVKTAVALITSRNIDVSAGVEISFTTGGTFCTTGWSSTYTFNYLGYSVYHGYDAVTAALLHRGVSPNITIESRDSYKGWPLLAYTTYKGQAAITLQLLKHKANPNQNIPNDAKKRSLLAYAMDERYTDIAVALVASGAQIDKLAATRDCWKDWSSVLEQTDNSQATTTKGPTDSKDQITVNLTPVTHQTTAVQTDEKKSDIALTILQPQTIPAGLQTKLSLAIFFALCTDNLSTNEHKDDRPHAVYNLIKFVIMDFPDFMLLTKKLSLQSSEVKESQSGKIFLDYVKHGVFHARMLQDKTPGTQLALPEQRKKWADVLERDVKQQDIFKGQLKETLTGYCQSSDQESFFEILSNEILSEIKPKETLADFINLIKPLLKNEFEKDLRLANAKFEKKAELINLIRSEIHLTINDKKIHSTHKPDIYSLRIRIGITAWLYKTKQLNEQDRMLYETSINIFNRLKQLRNKEDKTHKVTIEPFLIFEALLRHPGKERILVQSNQNSADSKDHDYAGIVGHVANKKFSYEKAKTDKTHSELSRSAEEQRSYLAFVRMAVNDWLANSYPVEYSVSRSCTSTTIQDYDEEADEELSYNQKLFINAFCEKFESFFYMYRALQDGTVKTRINEEVEKYAKQAEHFAHLKVNVKGHELPLGEWGVFIAKLVIWRKDRQIQKATDRMGFVFRSRSMAECAKLIRFAGECITKRFAMQLNLLLPDGIAIKLVAECAAERSIQYITSSDENVISHRAGLAARAWNSLVQTVNYKKYRPELLAGYKDPVRLIIDGVIEGKSEKDSAMSVGTLPFGKPPEEQSWIPAGIFRNTGLMVKKGDQFHLYRHENLATRDDKENKKEGTLVYGYSLVEPSELDLALSHGFVEDNTPIAEVIECFKKATNQEASTKPSTKPSLPVYKM